MAGRFKTCRCRRCVETWVLNNTHFHGTRVPVEEPSTASEPDLTLQSTSSLLLAAQASLGDRHRTPSHKRQLNVALRLGSGRLGYSPAQEVEDDFRGNDHEQVRYY